MTRHVPFIYIHHKHTFIVIMSMTPKLLLSEDFASRFCHVSVISPFFPSSDNLSLEDIQSLLRSAWLALKHFPSPTIYTTLCALLALTMGQQDPITTAMLHTQSLGITSRHRKIRHLASCLK